MRDRTGAGETRRGELETRRWVGERSEADEKRGKGEEVRWGNGRREKREREEVEKGKDKNKIGGRENITQLSTPLKCTVDKSSIM